MVYFPLVFPHTHLSTSAKGKKNSWVDWALTAQAKIWTQAYGFVARRANHCTTEAQIPLPPPLLHHVSHPDWFNIITE